MLICIFWFSVLGILTPYLLYPICLFVLSRLRPVLKPTGGLLPVTFVISAYNESDVIEEKIRNTLALDYPQDMLQVVVISDASDDGTDDIVSRYRQVELVRQPVRLGKSAGIDNSIDLFRGQIIVFSDANAMYRADAVAELVSHFGNQQVGYVVGRQLYREGKGGAQQSENTYWGFELKLKEWESRLSSVVGGDGAIMAIRRELFTPLLPDDINDFVLPLRIVVAGFRGRFEPRAICYEQAAPSFRGEFRRKVRIVNRSLRAVWRVPGAVNPFRVGVFAGQLFCHKMIRWFAAWLMLGALISSGLLASRGSTFFLVIMSFQVAFYGIAILAPWTAVGRFKPAMLAFYFCLANLAGGLGVLNFLLGRRFVTWTPQRDISKQNVGADCR